MATDYDTALRMQVHYLPLSFQPKARRGQLGRVWIESASVKAALSPNDRTLLLRYCTSSSPLFIEIYVDASTGLVYTESSNPAVSTVCETINNNARQRGATRLLTPLLATISREIQLGMEQNLLWPVSGPKAWIPSQRSPIESVIIDIFRGLLAHPIFSTSSSITPLQKGQAIIDGLGQHISLLTTALYTVRRLLICKPLPHWIMQTTNSLLKNGTPSTDSSSTSTQASSLLASFSTHSKDSSTSVSSPLASDVSSPHSTIADFDTHTLDRSIGGLGSLRHLLHNSLDGTIVSHNLASLSIESLLLLYWLLALAPVRLIRSIQPLVNDASASYIIIHGAYTSSWTHNSTPSTSPSSSPNKESFVSDTHIQEPLWDTYAAQKHRTYYKPNTNDSKISKNNDIVRWYHGTSTDNAYSAMSFGLRSLSGTRHQSSGAMYGDGIYVTNSINVAQSFAKQVGLAWAGYSTSIGAIATHEYNPNSSSTSSSSTSVQSTIQTHTKPCTQRVILEMDVIADPENKIMVDGKDITNDILKGTMALPPAAYLVVKDPCHLWMKAIHVYDEEVPIILNNPTNKTQKPIIIASPKVHTEAKSSNISTSSPLAVTASTMHTSSPSSPIQDIYRTRTLDNVEDIALLTPEDKQKRVSSIQRSLFVLIFAILIAYLTSYPSIQTWLQTWLRNNKLTRK